MTRGTNIEKFDLIRGQIFLIGETFFHPITNHRLYSI